MPKARDGYSGEVKDVIHIPEDKVEQNLPDTEYLDLIKGNINDLADSFRSLADFHYRELVAVQKIKQRYGEGLSTPDVSIKKQKEQEPEPQSASVAPAENIGEQKDTSVEQQADSSESLSEELPTTPPLPTIITERRRDIWKLLLQKSEYITNDQCEQVVGQLLNHMAQMNKEGYLVAVADCLENVVDKQSARIFLKKCAEIYQSLLRVKELDDALEKERYFSGADLLRYIDAGDPRKTTYADWPGLKEKFGKPEPVAKPPKASEVKQIASDRGGLPAVSEKTQDQAITQTPPPEFTAMVEAYHTTPDREHAYAVEQVIKAKLNASNIVLFEREKEDGYFAIGVKDWKQFLVDPNAGEKISAEYTEIAITPHQGLILVRNEEKGYGYIDYKGKEILAPEAGNYLPRYHNGSELICDGYKVVNRTTEKTLAEVEGGDTIDVFGNLYRTEVLLEQHGRQQTFENKLFDAQGRPLDFGDPKDIKIITERDDAIDYTSTNGASETTRIITNIAVKIEGKYGLVNALTGELVLPPKYKEISRFYGGFKFAGSRKKPVFGRNDEVVGYDEMAAKIPIRFIVTEDEQGNFRLLDQEYKDVFGQSYKSREELAEAYDVRYPNNSRKILFL